MIFTPPKSILAVRLSALGDIILLMPTLRRLQRSFPDAQLSWLVDPLFLPLLNHLQGIEFIPVQKPRNIKDYWHIYQTLHHRQFDCLLAFQFSFRSHLIYPMVRAPMKLGYSKQQVKDLHWLFINHNIPFRKEHLLDTAWRFADFLGAQDQTLDWGFTFTEQEIHWAQQLLPPTHSWIAMNPFASTAERSCSLAFYTDLIEQLVTAYPVNIVLTGGKNPAEIHLAHAIAQNFPQRLMNCVGKTSLRELAVILNQCDLMISPDTGPLHLADALGKPVIGLYAVAPPELCGPYHSLSRVVNCYPEAVRKFLNKDPEQIPWVTRVHHPQAMSLIQVTPVMERVTQWFNENLLSERKTP